MYVQKSRTSKETIDTTKQSQHTIELDLRDFYELFVLLSGLFGLLSALFGLLSGIFIPLSGLVGFLFGLFGLFSGLFGLLSGLLGILLVFSVLERPQKHIKQEGSPFDMLQQYLLFIFIVCVNMFLYHSKVVLL